jgi:hypothetical protein
LAGRLERTMYMHGKRSSLLRPRNNMHAHKIYAHPALRLSAVLVVVVVLLGVVVVLVVVVVVVVDVVAVVVVV